MPILGAHNRSCGDGGVCWCLVVVSLIPAMSPCIVHSRHTLATTYTATHFTPTDGANNRGQQSRTGIAKRSHCVCVCVCVPPHAVQRSIDFKSPPRQVMPRHLAAATHHSYICAPPASRVYLRSHYDFSRLLCRAVIIKMNAMFCARTRAMCRPHTFRICSASSSSSSAPCSRLVES